MAWCCRQGRPPHKQDGKWSVLVLVCTFLQAWLLIGIIRGFGVYLPILMAEFNTGRDKIALVGSMSGGLAFLLTVVTAWLNSFIDCRILCAVGHLSFIVAFTISSFVYRVELLYFTYSIFKGFGITLVLATNVLVLVKYFKKHRSLAQGINSAGGALGIMTVPNLLQFLIDSYGWRNTLRIEAAAVFMSSFLCLMFSPNVETENRNPKTEEHDNGETNSIPNIVEKTNVLLSPNEMGSLKFKDNPGFHFEESDEKDHGNIQKTEPELEEKIENAKISLVAKQNGIEAILDKETADHLDKDSFAKKSILPKKKIPSLRTMLDLSVWKVSGYRLAVISICVATFLMFSLSVHLVKFSEEMANLDGRRATTLYIFLGFASLIARIVAGKLCDISRIQPRFVNMTAEVIGGINAVLLTLSTSYIHLAVMYFIHGFADGMFRTSTIVLLTTSVERSKSGSAYGQGNSLAAPFNMAGPAITGLLADVFNGYTKAYYMNGCILLIAAAVHLVPALLRLRGSTGKLDIGQVSTTGLENRKINRQENIQISQAIDISIDQ